MEAHRDLDFNPGFQDCKPSAFTTELSLLNVLLQKHWPIYSYTGSIHTGDTGDAGDTGDTSDNIDQAYGGTSLDREHKVISSPQDHQ